MAEAVKFPFEPCACIFVTTRQAGRATRLSNRHIIMTSNKQQHFIVCSVVVLINSIFSRFFCNSQLASQHHQQLGGAS